MALKAVRGSRRRFPSCPRKNPFSGTQLDFGKTARRVVSSWKGRGSAQPSPTGLALPLSTLWAPKGAGLPVPLGVEVGLGRLTGRLPAAGTGLPAGPYLSLTQSPLTGGAGEAAWLLPLPTAGPHRARGAWPPPDCAPSKAGLPSLPGTDRACPAAWLWWHVPASTPQGLSWGRAALAGSAVSMWRCRPCAWAAPTEPGTLFPPTLPPRPVAPERPNRAFRGSWGGRARTGFPAHLPERVNRRVSETQSPAGFLTFQTTAAARVMGSRVREALPGVSFLRGFGAHRLRSPVTSPPPSTLVGPTGCASALAVLPGTCFSPSHGPPPPIACSQSHLTPWSRGTVTAACPLTGTPPSRGGLDLLCLRRPPAAPGNARQVVAVTSLHR